jgi:hypothetical protein
MDNDLYKLRNMKNLECLNIKRCIRLTKEGIKRFIKEKEGKKMIRLESNYDLNLLTL